MAKDHGSQIKDDEQYEALRREGASKEKAARIANAGSLQRHRQERRSRIELRGSLEGGAVREGEGGRHRGAVRHEQERAHRRPSQPLTAT
jgi:hypothetical protein